MPLKKKALPKKTCPICGERFQPIRRWQKYDKTSCNQKAFQIRTADKVRRLEELEAKGAA